MTIPSLIGVIHLRPLPGSPGFSGDMAAVAAACARDAHALADAGFDGIVVENYGDAPFEPGSVSPVTIAAMTRCALAARVAAPTVTLGINVLRNDAEAAIAIAVASGASLVRVNVHVGARMTDQGLIQGQAHRTLRMRRALEAQHVRLLCDVDVKHSAPVAPRPLTEETSDLVGRGGADAVLVTGSGTGRSVNLRELDEVIRAASVPVLVASGVTEGALAAIKRAHGVIVGSALRADGKAGGPVDPTQAKKFAEAFHAMKRAAAEGRLDSIPPA
ncbi:MAG: BtpA/SgcQ family protein [Polyangiaceae bacterium]|nr:BtpA/SgcQ family protein [Polyangiaceae bacterium]